MAPAAYDHIVAMVIVGVIFIGTVVALPAMTFSNFQTVDEQQLRNTALTVFDSMLLNGGSPSNWGSTNPSNWDQNNIELFGLASSSTLSKYVLDPDKVQRLDPQNPGVLEYNRVRDLLKLQDYGFRLSIIRPFSVKWQLNLTQSTVHFSVKVTRTEDATPIPNAQVSVTTMITASKPSQTNGSDLVSKAFEPKLYTTNALGFCQDTIDTRLAGYSIQYAVAIIKVTVGGLSTTVVAQNDNPITKFIKINTFGDTVTLSFRNELSDDETRSERRIIEIDAYDFENLYKVFDGTTSNPPDLKVVQGTGYEYWSMVFPNLRALNPTVLLFVLQLTLKNEGRVLVLLAGPFSFGGSEEIFGFGPEPTSEKVIAIMTRLVVIADMTYVAKIAFWRN
jgi:type II secretory pathway pseudopilin PulG